MPTLEDVMYKANEAYEKAEHANTKGTVANWLGGGGIAGALINGAIEVYMAMRNRGVPAQQAVQSAASQTGCDVAALVAAIATMSSNNHHDDYDRKRKDHQHDRIDALESKLAEKEGRSYTDETAIKLYERIAANDKDQTATSNARFEKLFDKIISMDKESAVNAAKLEGFKEAVKERFDLAEERRASGDNTLGERINCLRHDFKRDVQEVKDWASARFVAGELYIDSHDVKYGDCQPELKKC